MCRVPFRAAFCRRRIKPAFRKFVSRRLPCDLLNRDSYPSDLQIRAILNECSVENGYRAKAARRRFIQSALQRLRLAMPTIRVVRADASSETPSEVLSRQPDLFGKRRLEPARGGLQGTFFVDNIPHRHHWINGRTCPPVSLRSAPKSKFIRVLRHCHAVVIFRPRHRIQSCQRISRLPLPITLPLRRHLRL